MHFVCEVPSQSASTQTWRQSQPQEGDENRTVNVIDTTQSNGFEADPQTHHNFRCNCMRTKLTKFVGICISGLAVLIGGSVLIILYFTSFEYRGFLIPALCLFILGIALTSIGEWYCRTSLQRRQQARSRHRTRQRLRSSSSTHRSQEDSELPPSYYSLQQLPTTHSGILNGSYSPTVETSSNQFELTDNELPQYNAIKICDEEPLPSYQEATKIDFQAESAEKE